MIYLLRISWPSPVLSSNSRDHWAKVARAKKSAKLEAFAEAKKHRVKAMPNARLTFAYFPPDRRRRDAQNMPHAMKATIDGIAEAMGCDDNGFQCVFPGGFEKTVDGGCVMVEITDGAEC